MGCRTVVASFSGQKFFLFYFPKKLFSNTAFEEFFSLTSFISGFKLIHQQCHKRTKWSCCALMPVIVLDEATIEIIGQANVDIISFETWNGVNKKHGRLEREETFLRECAPAFHLRSHSVPHTVRKSENLERVWEWVHRACRSSHSALTLFLTLNSQPECFQLACFSTHSAHTLFLTLNSQQEWVCMLVSISCLLLPCSSLFFLFSRIGPLQNPLTISQCSENLNQNFLW